MNRLPAALLLGAAAVLALPAAPALAHVGIAPDAAAAGSFATYTFTVPNERAAEDTTGLDVTLPAGFTLGDAESLPGWRTAVDLRPDGTASAVHWTGGHLPPHTFGRFALRGRTGDAAGTLAFAAVQRYEHGSEQWTGPSGSEHPAPSLTVTAKAAATPAAASTGGAAGTDGLARSRAALALALAATMLAGLAAWAGLAALRRRASVAAEPAAAVAPRPGEGPEPGGARQTAKAGRSRPVPRQRAAR